MIRPNRLKIVLVALLWTPAMFAFAEPVDYAGHRVVRVEINTQADLQLLKSISPDIWSENEGLIPLDARIPPERMADLEASGLTYRVLIDDLGPLVKRQLEPVGRGTWDAYMSFDQIVAFINNLAATRPDLCEVLDIGNSIQSRDIWVLHITGPGPGPKPAVFYHALEHSREWITGPVVLYLADYLVNNYDTDPCVADLVNRLDIYLAPCVNPDGYAYTWSTYRLWRKNRRLNPGGSYGVDLNRNWGYEWGYNDSGSSPYQSDETYRGSAPFSEPETQALSNFISARPAIRAYMDYHSYSQLILWPWGYTCSTVPEPDATTFSTLGSEMHTLIQGVHGKNYTPSPICLGLYDANGCSTDWVYGDQNRFGFSIELRDIGEFGFVLPPEQILPTCEENLPAILRLTEWAANDVSFRFPSGVPNKLTAGADTTVALEIIPQFDSANPSTARIYYRYDSTGPFIEAALTHLSGNAYQAMLPATNCTSTPEFYFSVQSSGGQVVVSPSCAPTNVYSAAVVGPTATTFYANNLDASPGWTTEGLWAFGHPTGGGSYNHDPANGYTGTNVYGYNLSGDYANNLPARYLITTAINCSGKHNVALEFRRWLGVESNSDYDQATVEVSSNGVSWTVLWRAADTGGAVADTSWQLQALDISALADDRPAVNIRWGMGPTDSSVTYPGWNLDDVRLYSAECNAGKGDYNGDTLVNIADFVAFPPCLTGPGGGLLPGCGIFDFLDDGDVDLDDFARFQMVFGGP
ncbi:MAG: M14 family metallopeptidase [Planctomycetota bacterium]